MADKCTEELKLRLPESLLLQLSPLVSGLLAAAVFAGTWAACRRMRFTKRDDE